MNLPTQAEQSLFDHLSPDKKARVEQHFATLETTPNACMNCGVALAAEDFFCDDECRDAWWGINRAQMEREKTAGQREDAEEHRTEIIRERREL